MIKIVNDFFEKDKYDQVIRHIKNNVRFTPRYFDNTTDKTRENYYGDRFDLEQDKNLYDTFIKQAEKKFKFKIYKTFSCGIDLRNLDEWKPHVDDAKINVFIMLDGPIGVTTGTCFYTDNELDIHVGFRPNRAILFPSNQLHSPHKSSVKGMRRYTCSLFITDYEGLI